MQTWSISRRWRAGVGLSASLGAALGAAEALVQGFVHAPLWSWGSALGQVVADTGVGALSAAGIGLLSGFVHVGRPENPVHRNLALQAAIAAGALWMGMVAPFADELVARDRVGAGGLLLGLASLALPLVYYNLRTLLARQGTGRLRGSLQVWTTGGAALVALLAVFVSSDSMQPSAFQLRGHASVLLVSVDGLRADSLELPTDQAPHLHALAAQSVRFEAAFTPSTEPHAAVAAILSGRHPLRSHVVELGDRLSAGSPWLARALREEGFATAAFVSDVSFAPMGLDAGFRTFDDRWKSAFPRPDRIAVLGWLWPRLGAARPAASTVAACLDWMAAHRGEDAFVWVHLRLAPPALTTDVSHAQAWYTAQLRRVDDALGSLLAGLDELQVGERTLVWVVGSQGTMLGEHGRLHGGLDAWDELTQVPMLMRLPGELYAKSRLSVLTSTLDVATTTRRFLGLAREDRIEGFDRMATLEGLGGRDTSVVIVGKGAQGVPLLALRQRALLAMWDLAVDDVRLFDLARGTGSDEDIAREQPEAVEAIRTQLGEEALTLRKARSTGLTRLQRAQAHGLGYR